MGKISGTMRAMAAPVLGPLRQKRLVGKWSHHAFPGELDFNWAAVHYNRIAIINMICAAKGRPSYLEIGTFYDAMFNSVLAPHKVGVDPESGGTIRKTSDDFFASNSETFDVIFIDGLHTFEQVRQDVRNAIKCLKPDGWIGLHDMMPRNWREEHVPRISRLWTGDVWKVAFELLASDDLEFIICAVDHGVGLIKPGPKAQVADRFAELKDRDFSYYYSNLRNLPIMEWDAARPWIEARLH